MYNPDTSSPDVSDLVKIASRQLHSQLTEQSSRYPKSRGGADDFISAASIQLRKQIKESLVPPQRPQPINEGFEQAVQVVRNAVRNLNWVEVIKITADLALIGSALASRGRLGNTAAEVSRVATRELLDVSRRLETIGAYSAGDARADARGVPAESLVPPQRTLSLTESNSDSDYRGALRLARDLEASDQITLAYSIIILAQQEYASNYYNNIAVPLDALAQGMVGLRMKTGTKLEDQNEYRGAFRLARDLEGIDQIKLASTILAQAQHTYASNYHNDIAAQLTQDVNLLNALHQKADAIVN